MEWTTELSVGYGEIDEQHRELVRLLANLDSWIEAGEAPGVAAAIGALVGAVVRHFATEEALMERWQYPDRIAHKQAHDLFIQDVLALEREEAEVGLTQEVVDWARGRLPEWVSFHMLTNDGPLGRFLAGREARAAQAQPREVQRPKTS